MRGVLFWALVVANGAVYLAMVLWSLPEIARMAGGVAPFDLRPMGYAPDEARAFLAGLSDEGRAFYLGVQHRLDLVFPGLQAVTLILAFHCLAPGPLAWALSVVAAASAGFDWAENAAVAGLLAVPEPEVGAILWASRLTVLKSACVSVAMTALLALLARAGWTRWRQSRAGGDGE
jgi:hypothetical protein